MPEWLLLLFMCHMQLLKAQVATRWSSSRSEYGDGWSVTNESCLLLTSGESPRLTDSDHISAAVEGGHDCCYPSVLEMVGAGRPCKHKDTPSL